jgi:hypothetical protein
MVEKEIQDDGKKDKKGAKKETKVEVEEKKELV